MDLPLPVNGSDGAQWGQYLRLRLRWGCRFADVSNRYNSAPPGVVDPGGLAIAQDGKILRSEMADYYSLKRINGEVRKSHSFHASELLSSWAT